MYTLPPETTSTTSIMALLKPVEDTAPTMIPAVATATAILIMLRAPATKPAKISARPARTAWPIRRLPLCQECTTFCVTMMSINSTMA